MKTSTKILAATAIILVILLFAVRITGILALYSIPTSHNYPNIKVGTYVLVYKFAIPARHKYVAYTSAYEDSINAQIPDMKPGSVYLSHICGMPGDELQMINGELWVNGKNSDAALNLTQEYVTSKDAINVIEEKDFPADNFRIEMDSALVSFDKSLYQKYQHSIKLRRYLLTDTTATTSGAFSWYPETSWTADEFGPLKVPADCYFVLGDNRHNALDSRYIGFVKKENIKGVVLNK